MARWTGSVGLAGGRLSGGGNGGVAPDEQKVQAVTILVGAEVQGLNPGIEGPEA